MSGTKHSCLAGHQRPAQPFCLLMLPNLHIRIRVLTLSFTLIASESDSHGGSCGLSFQPTQKRNANETTSLLLASGFLKHVGVGQTKSLTYKKTRKNTCAKALMIFYRGLIVRTGDGETGRRGHEYRGVKKGLQNMQLCRTQAGLGRTVKQEQ